MTTDTGEIVASTVAGQGHDQSIEALQEILERQQLEPVTYEQARELGYELMLFFEALDAPGKEEENDGGTEHTV